MNTEQFNEIMARIEAIEAKLNFHTHTGLDSQVLPQIPSKLASAPQPAITPPSGGATIDGAARGAINAIITTLKNLGLTN